jgi:hypothetical protein
MTRNIFELSDEILQLDALLETLGEDEDGQRVVLEKYMSSLQGNLEIKLDGYADYTRELEVRSEARKAEANRIMQRSKVDANKAARLKECLKWYFTTRNLKTCETPKHRITLCSNGGVQSISINVPVEELPAEYVREIITYKPDLELIRDKLQSGEVLPFATLEKRKMSIRIG